MAERRNWFSGFRPGLKKREEKKSEPDTSGNLWIKCPATGELIYQSDLEHSQWVTPAGHHMRIGPEQRFRYMFDDAWTALKLPEVPTDPFKFKDDKRYTDRLKAARAKTGSPDCMAAAYGEINGAPAVLLVQNFEFMGGSLGMAAGEAFITAAREAVRRGCPLICFSASGGARMQEGILSLMQMPRTTLAIEEVREAGLPYLVVLTDPTSGGVTASYAMLGDVHFAEPGALIAFSGPRVIEQTIRQKLPEGFQRAEFLLDKGMVDAVLDRRQLKEAITAVLSVLMAKRLEREASPAKEPELPLEIAPPRPPGRLADSPRRAGARPRARAAE